MLRIKKKPYDKHAIAYYSYINYNHTNGFLLEEDRILESINAYLPTTQEYFYRKRKYRILMKPWKYLDEYQSLMKFKQLMGGVDVSKL